MARPVPVDKWQEKYELDEDVRAYARAKAIDKDPKRKAAMMKHAKTMKAEHEKRRDESAAICRMADSK